MWFSAFTAKYIKAAVVKMENLNQLRLNFALKALSEMKAAVQEIRISLIPSFFFSWFSSSYFGISVADAH